MVIGYDFCPISPGHLVFYMAGCFMPLGLVLPFLER